MIERLTLRERLKERRSIEAGHPEIFQGKNPSQKANGVPKSENGRSSKRIVSSDLVMNGKEVILVTLDQLDTPSTLEEKLDTVDGVFSDWRSSDDTDDSDLSNDAMLEKDIDEPVNNEFLDDSTRMYLKKIGQYKLLTSEQEFAYGRKRAEIDAEIKEMKEKIKRNEDVDPSILPQLEEKRKGAVNELVKPNLRLVVSIAKKYLYRGLSLLDLIEEGNLGLIRGAEKYDHKKGFRFSTYATWWIRQAITRGIADQSRDVRLPVRMNESVKKLRSVTNSLLAELGREPTDNEIVTRMEISHKKLSDLRRVGLHQVSLNAPIDDKGGEFGDNIFAKMEMSVEDQAIDSVVTEQIREILDDLTEREFLILDKRFGLTNGTQETLDEVGKFFGVTRERIRQIESETLRKLAKNHPHLLEILTERKAAEKRVNDFENSQIDIFYTHEDEHGEANQINLTPREVTILQLLATGFNITQIAGQLDIKLGTVRQHIYGNKDKDKGLFNKLDVRSMDDLMSKAHQKGLLVSESIE